MVSIRRICLFSVSQLKSFLKDIGKIRTKKLLPFFQKDFKNYIKSLEKGAWLPIVRISSLQYVIKVSNAFETFNDDWIEIYSYSDFYIHIGNDNAIWISSIGKLLNFDEKEYINSNDGIISYNTLDGETINSAVRYNINEGDYSVTIKGYKKCNENIGGFLFSFTPLKSPITKYKDPRQDELYKFNEINKFNI